MGRDDEGSREGVGRGDGSALSFLVRRFLSTSTHLSVL